MKIKVLKGSIKIEVLRGEIDNVSNYQYDRINKEHFICAGGGFETNAYAHCFMDVELKNGSEIDVQDFEISCRNGKLLIPVELSTINEDSSTKKKEVNSYAISNNIMMKNISGDQKICPMNNEKSSILIEFSVYK
jgi:hypothetical protein